MSYIMEQVTRVYLIIIGLFQIYKRPFGDCTFTIRVLMNIYVFGRELFFRLS